MRDASQDGQGITADAQLGIGLGEVRHLPDQSPESDLSERPERRDSVLRSLILQHVGQLAGGGGDFHGVEGLDRVGSFAAMA